MKFKFTAILLISVFLVSIATAQIPRTINYQGLLTDAGGTPLADNNHTITFSLYDDPGANSPLWTSIKSVGTESGLFNVVLGNDVQIDLPFDTQYWLGIQVESDPEMTPRIELTSSAYSFSSVSSDYSHNTGAIGGQEVSTNAPTNGDVLKWNGSLWAPGSDNAGTTVWATSGNNIYYDQGYVGIGDANPGTGLSLKNAAGYGSALALYNTGGGLEWRLASWIDGTLRFVKVTGTTFSPIVIEPVAGKVGIGTSAPDQQLSVHTASGISYIRVSDNTTGPASGLRMGLSGSGNAYIINDETTKSLSLGTDGTTQVRITDIGRVGINELNPGQLLHLKQDAANKGFRIEHQSTTDFWENGIGTTTKNYKFYYNNLFRADISSVDGAYTQSSDRRLKKDIKPISNVLDKVAKLKPSTYQYIDNNGQGPRSTGFVAQDVETIFPDLVRETDDGYKGITYDGFAVIAIKAIQEQQKIIEELRNRIEELERR